MKDTWEKNNTLKESGFYNHLFKDERLASYYEELKRNIGADNLCDEIATEIDKEELIKILDHISDAYGF